MLEEEPKKIKYVKHPLTKADKRKLQKQGFKIIDERFDPDYKPPVKAVEPAKEAPPPAPPVTQA